jgi:dihydropteroate synthase
VVTGRIWRCRDVNFPLGRRTVVMGVVNVTPDSFSDGGLYADADAAVGHGARLADEGAHIVDVGGESTRPGAEPVSLDEELHRVVPVVERLRAARPDVAISVDTRHVAVATAALAAGAVIVNDISGGDPDILRLAADASAGVVLMHMQGEPRSMQDDPRYDDVVGEVHSFLRERVEAAVFAGVDAEHVCVDPGIGFGKTLEHNVAILGSLETLRDLDAGLVIGVSRKRFIGTLTQTEDATDRLEGSLAAAVLAVAGGADVVRVHDVRATVRAVRVADAIARRP